MSFPLFFDFEFEVPYLISFGATTLPVEGGELSLYVELTHPKEGFTSPFVIDTVLPLLEKKPSERKTMDEFRQTLSAFLNVVQPTSLVCDSEIDRELMLSLLPDASVDVIQFENYSEESAFGEAHDTTYDPVLRPRHHALHDAEAIRAGWQALKTHRMKM